MGSLEQAVYAIIISFVIGVILCPIVIPMLRKLKFGQNVRDDGPQTHLAKQGTPTMGGVAFLAAFVITSLFFLKGNRDGAAIMLMTLCYGLIGFLDDFVKVVRHRNLGLLAWQKLVMQFIVTGAFMAGLNSLGLMTTIIMVPAVGAVDLGIFYYPIAFFGIIFLVNAVNLTDGLDGLAAGTVMIVMIVMAAIAYRSDMLDSAIFAAALAGACVGFLWFNSFPADIFMGDTGSLALGMALGCLAVFTKSEFIVLVIGGLFVAEALSVMIQVFYYKKTHKRIFLMAPLHHHFEKKGWSETKVVVRFWIVSGVLAALGFAVYFAETLMAVA